MPLTSTRSSPPTGSLPPNSSPRRQLWVFVTTAARYADAVPWDLLRSARERSAAVSGPRPRARPTAFDEVTSPSGAHAGRPRAGRSPAVSSSPRPPCRRTTAPDVVAGITGWLRGLLRTRRALRGDPQDTRRCARQHLPTRRLLITEVDAQARAARDLRNAVTSAYAAAVDEVDAAVRRLGPSR